RYGEQVHLVSYDPVSKRAPAAERLAFRTSTVLISTQPEPGQPHRTMLVPPELKAETSGFWKSIGPMEEGEDRKGRPIVGRTWVTQHRTWIERRSTRPILTGDSIRVPNGPDP